MKKWKWIAAVSAAAAVLAIPVSAKETESTPAEMIEIGEGGSDEDFVVVLNNDTGKDVTSIAVTVSGEEGENLLSDKEVLADQLSARLTLVPAPMDEVTFMPATYDLVLTFDDKTEAVLHSFPFGDTDSVTIAITELTEEQLDDPKDADKAQIAYITYESDLLGAEQSTLLKEWGTVAPGKAAEAAAESGSGEGAAGAGDDEWCLTGGLLD